jgi:hypothetical protein
MEHEHTQEAIHQRLAAGPEQRAHLAPRIILILGGANLIADGLAMAPGNYLATRSERVSTSLNGPVFERMKKSGKGIT